MSQNNDFSPNMDTRDNSIKLYQQFGTYGNSNSNDKICIVPTAWSTAMLLPKWQSDRLGR
ncbi:hypothetical protein [Photorhabdus bodei]|uniref:Uncharacterized protein n=1 Tax=Photorhabdus bodei TaxID=2029681 RepID=A0ABX0AL38_9GAMM|nr:hypothetical protein [Photorhabdus bodei]NDK98696.1 hypothetical protein [Photorhabdus bodei]NDL03708.1 hypothetical protein [Photorhabdus bodei]NDL07154.1 hypothetical protein [Photorhabdus bodei]